MVTTQMPSATVLYKLKSVMDGEEISISKKAFTVGRDAECDIVLDQEQGYPSRIHAQIILKDGKILVDDLNSTNGTFVNDSKIKATTQIFPGDLLRFATTEFRLVDANDSDETVIARPPSKVKDADSFIVVEEQDVDPEQTALRQQYPLPAGWPVENTFSSGLFDKVDIKGEQKEIKKLINAALKDSDKIYVAAVVFKAEGMEPVVFGIPLESKTSKWSIGRSAKCDFQVDMPSVSEHHADLVFQKNTWLIRDNDSTNGLYLEDSKETSIALSQSSKVSIGQVDMQFREVKWKV